jgi:hypothetical protein
VAPPGKRFDPNLIIAPDWPDKHWKRPMSTNLASLMKRVIILKQKEQRRLSATKRRLKRQVQNFLKRDIHIREYRVWPQERIAETNNQKHDERDESASMPYDPQGDPLLRVMQADVRRLRTELKTKYGENYQDKEDDNSLIQLVATMRLIEEHIHTQVEKYGVPPEWKPN